MAVKSLNNCIDLTYSEDDEDDCERRAKRIKTQHEMLWLDLQHQAMKRLFRLNIIIEFAAEMGEIESKPSPYTDLLDELENKDLEKEQIHDEEKEDKKKCYVNHCWRLIVILKLSQHQPCRWALRKLVLALYEQNFFTPSNFMQASNNLLKSIMKEHLPLFVWDNSSSSIEAPQDLLAQDIRSATREILEGGDKLECTYSKQVERTSSSRECKVHIIKIARALNWARGEPSIPIEGDEMQQHMNVLKELNSWIFSKMLRRKVIEVLPYLGQYMEHDSSVASLCELVEKDYGTTNDEKKETKAMIKCIADYYKKVAPAGPSQVPDAEASLPGFHVPLPSTTAIPFRS